MATFYRGYRVGSIEKEFLKLFLGIGRVEFDRKNKWQDEGWSSILKISAKKGNLSNAINSLHKKNLIKLKHNNKNISIEITQSGKRYLKDNLFSLDKEILNKKYLENKKWDGIWHIVIFDIPEKRKKVRDIIRYNLRKIGFVQLQGSVWVFPYECSEIVTLIKTNFKMNKEVVYIESTYIEGESILMKHFKVSR